MFSLFGRPKGAAVPGEDAMVAFAWWPRLVMSLLLTAVLAASSAGYVPKWAGDLLRLPLVKPLLIVVVAVAGRVYFPPAGARKKAPAPAANHKTNSGTSGAQWRPSTLKCFPMPAASRKMAAAPNASSTPSATRRGMIGQYFFAPAHSTAAAATA